MKPFFLVLPNVFRWILIEVVDWPVHFVRKYVQYFLTDFYILFLCRIVRKRNVCDHCFELSNYHPDFHWSADCFAEAVYYMVGVLLRAGLPLADSRIVRGRHSLHFDVMWKSAEFDEMDENEILAFFAFGLHCMQRDSSQYWLLRRDCVAPPADLTYDCSSSPVDESSVCFRH